MQVIYNGTDIYDEVTVGRCWCDMHAWGAMDCLTIDFPDTGNLWDSWSPKEGDTISVVMDEAKTGEMIVSSVVPSSSLMTIVAYPAPQSIRERRNKSWETVHLFQLISEVAGRHGLSMETYGLTNYEYEYVAQDNESDMEFLSRRLTYEGASMVIYDGKLIAYSGSWLESQEVAGEIDVDPGVDYEFRDRSASMYGSCTATDGSMTGTYTAGDGKSLVCVVPERMGSTAEAQRFAKGLLREANREAAMMTIRTDSMLKGYAAGSIVTVNASAASSWGGTAVISRMRHDYLQAASKVWLCKPLGGY